MLNDNEWQNVMCEAVVACFKGLRISKQEADRLVDSVKYGTVDTYAEEN
jgi:hypothetical protein